jgi:hypothetical protein
MRNPMVTPTPEQLLGFPTWEEAQHAQKVCLTKPMPKVRQFLQGLAPAVRTGRIRVIQPEHPQPPTKGPTAWADDDPALHRAVQQVHIKTTAN